ncbi:glycoside hydrolase family 130 protein [Terriglobus roseus]|nr:glycoside hydrolase family 130 protein [Terriglobus roseus]
MGMTVWGGLLGICAAQAEAAPSEPLAGLWTRASTAPVIAPQADSTFLDPITAQSTHWEALHTFNPAAVVRDGKVYVLYRAEDDSGSMEIGGHVSRLGLAVSEDGVHFRRMPQPVLFPAKDSQEQRESPGGVEDPRIVESPDGGYVLTYTQWSRKLGRYSVGIATSKDLTHWQKHGPAFAGALDGRYDTYKYKSAAILTEVKGEHLVAARVQGKYWMFWGDLGIRAATSTDLVHWIPVESSPGTPRVILVPRAAKPDSDFPEAGPPPVLTRQGIVMLYNAKNKDGDGADPSLKAGTYSVLRAVLAADDPLKVIARTDTPVFKPELPFEQSGQYAAGTTFGEGLVLFKGKWWLYYGCADSFVGVAWAPAEK